MNNLFADPVRKYDLLAAVLFTALVIVIYAAGIEGEFIKDDYTFYANNEALSRLGPLDFEEIFFRENIYWGQQSPVFDYLCVLQINLFGTDTAGYHITSIALYIILCWQVYFFMRRLFRDSKGGISAKRHGEQELSAFVITAIFAAHPAHVECVAYITGQRDLLYSIFLIASLHSFWSFFNSSGKRKHLLVAAVVFLYFSVLSKTTAVFVVLLIPVMYAFSNRKTRPSLLSASISWTTLMLPIALWIIWGLNINNRIWKSTSALNDMDLLGKLIRAVKIFGAHTLHVFKPFPLSFGYPFNSSPNATGLDFIIGTITIVLLIALIIIYRRDLTIVFAAALIISSVAPVLQLGITVSNDMVYDRYILLAVAGFAIILEQIVSFTLRKSRLAGRTYLTLFATLTLVLSFLSHDYVPTFKNDLASLKNSYDAFPEWPSGAFRYVKQLIKLSQFDEAYAIIEKRGTFAPWVRSYFLGRIYLGKGDTDAAIRELEASTNYTLSNGLFPYAGTSLGEAYMKTGRLDEAKRAFMSVLNAPSYEPHEVYMAKLYLRYIRMQNGN